MPMFRVAGSEFGRDYSTWTPMVVSSASSRPNSFFTNNPYLSAGNPNPPDRGGDRSGQFRESASSFLHQHNSGQHRS